MERNRPGTQRFQVMDDRDCQEKSERGQGRDPDQGHVYSAMRRLAGSALAALGKMRLQIAAHLGGRSGNVIPPGRKDVANGWINTLAHFARPLPSCIRCSATPDRCTDCHNSRLNRQILCLAANRESREPVRELCIRASYPGPRIWLSIRLAYLVDDKCFGFYLRVHLHG
jgi:hypothetical protein